MKKEINNFFNLDDVNFSEIGTRNMNREESEMFELRSINQQISGNILPNQFMIPQKKPLISNVDFMNEKPLSTQKPFIPEQIPLNTKN